MSTNSEDNLGFNDNIQLLKCLVCLDEFQGQDVLNGLVCENNHFICHNDLKQYVIENIFTQIHKLRERNCAITCPCTDCSSQYNLLDIFIRLEQQEKKRLVNLIEDLVFPNDRNVKALKDAILDMMTLKCPNCKFPVDPFPDACSAVLCLSCGCHYCNYCFTGFSSGNREQDRVDAHNDAATHSTAVIKDSFLSPEVVAVGQKEHRKKQIIKCLSIAMKSKGLSVKENHLVTVALITCHQEVQDLGLEIISLFTNAFHNVIGKEKMQSEYTLSDNSSDPIGEEDTLTILGQSGPLLANAIVTKNDEAIKQILSSNRDIIDLNFVDTQYGHSLVSLATLNDVDWLAKILIGKGANPFLGNLQGRNLIYVVIEKGKIELLELIIQMYKETPQFYDRLTTDFTAYNGLHVAIRYNQESVVKRLVELGFNIEAPENEFGYSPLFLAVIMGFEWIATGLIYYGADVKAVARSGRTPLYVAAEKGYLSLLCQMISHTKFDINEPVEVKSNYRLLHVAASLNQFHIVQKLLDLKADINLSADGITPFVAALISKKSVIALELIKAGADVTIPYKLGKPPLYIAIEKGLTEVVKHLITECHLDINAKLYNGSFHTYPLNIVLSFNHPKLVPVLISLGADVNLKNDEGFTPLLAALLKKNPPEEHSHLQTEIALELIKAGADVAIPNIAGRPPLYIAIEKGLTEVVKHLITECKLDINAKLYNGTLYTYPLNIAISYKQPHLVPVLISLGADVNLKNDEGFTPLLTALLEEFPCDEAIHQQTQIALELIKAGADVTIPHQTGQPPLFIAVRKGLTEVVTYLLTECNLNLNAKLFSGSFYTYPLNIAITYNQPHLVPILLSLGVDVNLKDEEGFTPLISALVKDFPNEAISIIEKGADIYEPNAIGRFPLFVAVERGHTDVIKYLKKEKKVKLNVPVTNEKSAYFPIQVAVMYGQSHIISLLISLGAMVNPPNSYTKYTPLQNAVLLNDKISTLQLLVNGANSIMITRDNKSAIYIAVEKGYLDIVRLLFQYSTQPAVNVNAPITSDGSDMNALHVACMFNHPHIVLDLLSLGANIFVLDSNSKSPLDIAVEYEANDCKDAINELITRWNITKDKNAKLYSIAYK